MFSSESVSFFAAPEFQKDFCVNELSKANSVIFVQWHFKTFCKNSANSTLSTLVLQE